MVPRASGVARLRVCLYHAQAIVQSFRFAAVVAPPRTTRFLARGHEWIATALGVAPAQVYGLS